MKEETSSSPLPGIEITTSPALGDIDGDADYILAAGRGPSAIYKGELAHGGQPFRRNAQRLTRPAAISMLMAT